ncbi:MAG TPA: cupin domain-containing protein [Methylomirabilota bacterium]|nr:cupin domain-containing protein [Methylomirabilota bacterium]
MTRPRLAVFALLVFLAGFAAGQALSQPRPRMWTDVLLRITAADIPRRTAVQVNDDHWEPGAETGRHQHPGPTILYVLEGELAETAADGTATLRAGQAFWRPARHEHNVRNGTGRPARMLSIHLDPAQ